MGGKFSRGVFGRCRRAQANPAWQLNPLQLERRASPDEISSRLLRRLFALNQGNVVQDWHA